MVKKIDSTRSPQTVSTQPVGSKAIGKASEVSGTEQVKGATGQGAPGRIRRPTRPMTTEERAHLFRLIQEEADKMFGANGLPSAQRDTLEGAVRMTVDASLVEDDGEEKK